MIRLLFIFLVILKSTSFACTLCTVYSPLTLATINLELNDTQVKTLNINLKLTKEFTLQLYEVYDINANGLLEDNELLEVQLVFEDYAHSEGFFINIYYDELPNSKLKKEYEVYNLKTYIKNNLLHFSYDVKLDYKFFNDYYLKIKLIDKRDFFIIKLQEVTVNSKKTVIKQIDNNQVLFNFNTNELTKKENISSINKNFSKDKIIEKVEVIKNKESQSSYLSKAVKLLKNHLLLAQEGSYLSLFLLLLISFAYGIVHSIGPGHNKVFAFSYFSLYKTSLKKAFFICQASAFVHILGALIIVLISVFLLESVLNNFIDNAVSILTQLSAILMMLLALYIVYLRLKKQNCSCNSCKTTQWSINPPTAKKQLNEKKDLWFILTSGLIPCPGTVLLFIYAFTLKTYFAVILASIFISFGMGLVMFLSAFFGIGLSSFSQKSHKITKIVGIVSPLIMFLLGVVLFISML